MNKYIEINQNNEIIDVFFDWQKPKMKSQTKILLEEDTQDTKQRINGKSISVDVGEFIFTYIDGVVTERIQEEIESSATYIQKYKKLKKDEMEYFVNNNSLTDGITRDWPDIKARWQQFKADSENWTTKQEIDDAVNQAKTWLTS